MNDLIRVSLQGDDASLRDAAQRLTAAYRLGTAGPDNPLIPERVDPPKA